MRRHLPQIDTVFSARHAQQIRLKQSRRVRFSEVTALRECEEVALGPARSAVLAVGWLWFLNLRIKAGSAPMARSRIQLSRILLADPSTSWAAPSARGPGISSSTGESKRSLVTGHCHARICGSPG
jgi:hypothetical protein